MRIFSHYYCLKFQFWIFAMTNAHADEIEWAEHGIQREAVANPTNSFNSFCCMYIEFHNKMFTFDKKLSILQAIRASLELIVLRCLCN